MFRNKKTRGQQGNVENMAQNLIENEGSRWDILGIIPDQAGAG